MMHGHAVANQRTLRSPLNLRRKGRREWEGTPHVAAAMVSMHSSNFSRAAETNWEMITKPRPSAWAHGGLSVRGRRARAAG